MLRLYHLSVVSHHIIVSVIRALANAKKHFPECILHKARYMNFLAGKLISINAKKLQVLWQRLMAFMLAWEKDGSELKQGPRPPVQAPCWGLAQAQC